jgi:hypothetical protein
VSDDACRRTISAVRRKLTDALRPTRQGFQFRAVVFIPAAISLSSTVGAASGKTISEFDSGPARFGSGSLERKSSPKFRCNRWSIMGAPDAK